MTYWNPMAVSNVSILLKSHIILQLLRCFLNSCWPSIIRLVETVDTTWGVSLCSLYIYQFFPSLHDIENSENFNLVICFPHMVGSKYFFTTLCFQFSLQCGGCKFEFNEINLCPYSTFQQAAYQYINIVIARIALIRNLIHLILVWVSIYPPTSNNEQLLR